jgi:dTMP kinase
LDITPEKAKERGGYGEERYEKEELQNEVRRVFDRIAKEMLRDGGKWVTLDAGQERVAVSEDLWELVDPLTAGTESPVQRLWSDKDVLHELAPGGGM